jgi:TPR repeat protein
MAVQFLAAMERGGSRSSTPSCENLRNLEKEVLGWWQRSACNGGAHAQHRLGALYERGSLSLDPDPTEALKWYGL